MTRLAALFLCLASAMCAAGNPWHWVKTTEIGGQKWDISSGDAEVEISDGKITATLFWEGEAALARISLEGSVVDGKLVVKETIHNSDAGHSTYTGTLIVQEYKGLYPGKTEVITLSDGFSMIGLTRATVK